MKDLEQKTATKIIVPGVQDQSDIITITGTKEGIEKAEHEIRVISDEQVILKKKIIYLLYFSLQPRRDLVHNFFASHSLAHTLKTYFTYLNNFIFYIFIYTLPPFLHFIFFLFTYLLLYLIYALFFLPFYLSIFTILSHQFIIHRFFYPCFLTFFLFYIVFNYIQLSILIFDHFVKCFSLGKLLKG